MSDTQVDAEAALDHLIEAGVVNEDEEGLLSTTDSFEETRRIYRDTYGHIDDDVFEKTIADLFDVDRETAAEQIEARGITREELTAYLSIRSFLPDPPGHETLATMAALVVQIGPGSPVPDSVTELEDEDVDAFLDEHPDAIITVWKNGCDPCDAMKEDLDDILALVPDDVAVAGVDGEAVDDFRRTYDVNAAPAVLAFRDGDLKELVTGRKSPNALETLFDDVYGDENEN